MKQSIMNENIIVKPEISLMHKSEFVDSIKRNITQQFKDAGLKSVYEPTIKNYPKQPIDYNIFFHATGKIYGFKCFKS